MIEKPKSKFTPFEIFSDLLRRVREYYRDTDRLSYPPAPAVTATIPVKKPRKPKKKAPKRNGR